ncbi:hypothetical protein BDV26DRAFT_224066 [Aspergillus bertholletiae]|uniref:Uncharacterized protein n=1 Tax=Aspergillus bertholletiae TaxID=1226010 RepID=A0A5N7BLS8_9EURO|nr:hypothetical protein BDV26DRAFT_224066 [Aspergillus bertholletiae]
MESFDRVIASCSFRSTTQDTGNAVHSWEYWESLRSIVALDFETVGYDLVGRHISDGEYFDKACFCNAFTMDRDAEPCPGSGELDFTKERLWINAVCGSTSLPKNWTDTLRTTVFAYIPTEACHWPMSVADMPKQVIDLHHQCATDACEIDSSGYCKATRAVDRACFCRNIKYDSCGGSCREFEGRIDYIKWLHNVCGNVHDWHGLPDNWRQIHRGTGNMSLESVETRQLWFGWYSYLPCNSSQSGYRQRSNRTQLSLSLTLVALVCHSRTMISNFHSRYRVTLHIESIINSIPTSYIIYDHGSGFL